MSPWPDWETGETPAHLSRRAFVLPLAALPTPKKRRTKKEVGRGFTASELQAIREIERERKPIPSFDQLVREHRESV